MTKEEKQILLQDLSARLPYHTKIDTGVEGIATLDGTLYEINRINLECDNDAFLPYLRPMSSMTEEEWKNFRRTLDGGDCEINDDGETDFIMLWFEPCQLKSAYNCLDYLNSIHIDYRGLIPMGLALEAPEGMYVKKEGEK